MSYKFTILGLGWLVGDKFIDQDFTRQVNGGSNLIDTALPQWAWLANGVLSGSRVPPVTSQAYDQFTYDSMVAVYGYDRVLAPGPGVVPAGPPT